MQLFIRIQCKNQRFGKTLFYESVSDTGTMFYLLFIGVTNAVQVIYSAEDDRTFNKCRR